MIVLQSHKTLKVVTQGRDNNKLKTTRSNYLRSNNGRTAGSLENVVIMSGWYPEGMACSSYLSYADYLSTIHKLHEVGIR